MVRTLIFKNKNGAVIESINLTPEPKDSQEISKKIAEIVCFISAIKVLSVTMVPREGTSFEETLTAFRESSEYIFAKQIFILDTELTEFFIEDNDKEKSN